jgi:hypothetical protein
LVNSNDAFRQKQAQMKLEMKQDFQNFMHQNQNIDPRKQKIQRQRQPIQDAGGFLPGLGQSRHQPSEEDRKSQIANEVFAEILHKKGTSIHNFVQKPQESKHN